jgi:hypothetical protein
VPVRLCPAAFFEPLIFGCDGQRGMGISGSPRFSFKECQTTHAARCLGGFTLYCVNGGCAVTDVSSHYDPALGKDARLFGV